MYLELSLTWWEHQNLRGYWKAISKQKIFANGECKVMAQIPDWGSQCVYRRAKRGAAEDKTR